MHEKIADIQNSFWKAYKNFKDTKDMTKYNEDIEKITDRYQYHGQLTVFCFNMACAWAPIINGMKEWS